MKRMLDTLITARAKVPNYPEYRQEVVDAMEEAKQLSRNLETKRYRSFKEALEDNLLWDSHKRYIDIL